MPYTGDPANVPGDAVRLNVGDTDNDALQFTDAEIAFFLSQGAANVLVASIGAAHALAAKYARRVDKAVGDLRISYSHLQKHYAELAGRLEYDLAKSPAGGSPYAGGISIADKDSNRADTDRPRPDFYRGIQDDPQIRNDGAEYLRGGDWP